MCFRVNITIRTSDDNAIFNEDIQFFFGNGFNCLSLLSIKFATKGVHFFCTCEMLNEISLNGGQVDELHVYHKIMSLICYFYTNLLYFCTKKEPVTITDSNCIFFIKLRCMPTIINFFRSKETFYTIWITNTDLNMRLFSKSRGLIDRIAF